ncbi:MAG: ammonia-forming cytochrome c nitrite reductase subunit c552 [Planctomycetota bacterium]|nr:MAG: ammonia-forming cytochrome c nitrite reductase subunit c552 [Planctomycetota bacterium]
MGKEQSAGGAENRAVWVGWAIFAVLLIATVLIGVLGSSILQRRQEALPQKPLKPIGRWETDSSKWAENFPREYDRYRRMLDDTTKTKYGGAFPRDYLEDTPANVILFSGYGFAKEYRQARGHVYAIEDVTSTARVGAKTPATCWTCKSPDVPRLMEEMGTAEFYKASFAELKDEITHPIGCADCHDPETMQLTITRPALREALQRQGRDLKSISHQEMRTLVCAQCHVEYYFKGDGKYLTFPWDKGTSPEKMEEYYDESDFADWTHAVSKTPMVKMQHPDYEVYMTGIHAYRGVSCADCHMPYMSEGGVKFTDHHVQSPLLNIENSCAVCHRWGEEEIRARVEATQDKIREARRRAEDALCKAHFDVAACMQAGASDDELEQARSLIRAAQLRWDYVAANNGMGFHSPAECLRVLTASLELAGEARLEAARVLAAHGVTGGVVYPDYSTKEKAQALNAQFIEGNPPDLLPKE